MERAELERLRWRCIRRALLELDLSSRGFSTKASKILITSSSFFEELVLMEDHDLWYLISGQTECHDPRLAPHRGHAA